MALVKTAEQYEPIWTEGNVPRGYWNDEENQKNAVKWLIQKEEKVALTKRSFGENGLGGLLSSRLSSSVHNALNLLDESDWQELEPVVNEENVYTRLKTEPWTLVKAVPMGYWQNEENVKNAIRWLVQEEGALPRFGDYYANGLSHIITSLFESSPYKALLFLEKQDWKELESVIGHEDVYGRLRTEPWTLLTPVPLGFWEDQKNRESAIKWLIEKKRKVPGYNDYSENSLKSLLANKFGSSPHKALLSLDESDWQELEQLVNEENVYTRLRTEPWTLLTLTPKGILDSGENQREAVKWLVRKMGEMPTKDDYCDNGLRGLLDRFGNSTYGALLSLDESDWEGLEPAINERNVYARLRTEPWSLMKSVPTGYWKDLNNRRSAIKWLIEKEGRLPKYKDYLENGLGGLIRQFNSNLYNALVFLDELDWQELEKEIPWITMEYSDYLVEKGIETSVKPLPPDFWKEEDNRRGTIKWLIKKQGRIPEYNDYISNGLGSLIRTFDNNLYNALASLYESDLKELEKKIPGITQELTDYLAGKELDTKLQGPPKRMQEIAGRVLEFLEERNIKTSQDLKRCPRKKFFVGESGDNIYVDPISSLRGTSSRITYLKKVKKGEVPVFEARIFPRQYSEVIVTGHFQIKQYEHDSRYSGKNTRKIDPTIFRLKLELTQLKNPGVYTLPSIPKD